MPIPKIHNEEEISRDYSIRWGSIAGSMSSSSNTGKNATSQTSQTLAVFSSRLLSRCACSVFLWRQNCITTSFVTAVCPSPSIANRQHPTRTRTQHVKFNVERDQPTSLRCITAAFGPGLPPRRAGLNNNAKNHAPVRRQRLLLLSAELAQLLPDTM